MSAEESAQILSAIDEAIAAGKPWVAFNDRFDKDPDYHDLRFFGTATEAGIFSMKPTGRIRLPPRFSISTITSICRQAI